MWGLIGIKEHISLAFGAVILSTLLPLVGPVVLCAMTWEAIDRGFNGGFVKSNKELSGFLMAKVFPTINKATHSQTKRFMKNPSDSFVVNLIILQGVIIPIIFYLEFLHAMAHGFSRFRCFTYNVFRIGPYFMGFAYYYTMCHKEGHSMRGLFANKYHNLVSKSIFNWWIALFFGVMPAAFAFGHSMNHHRYDNGPLDVVTTADKPRDSFANFVAYLPRWTLYSLNISSIYQFLVERNFRVAFSMLGGCVYWWSWFALWARNSLPFALGYVLYPFAENIILLAAINWSWHAFNDADNPGDEYVTSLTIFDGPMNILNEDYHVVHHQYPGAHWTEHPSKVAKHWAEYQEHRATCFRTTHAFEVFALVVAGDYRTLAEKFIDVKGERDGNAMVVGDKEIFLKKRLRVCTWGPRVTNSNACKGQQSAGTLQQDPHSKEVMPKDQLTKPPSA